MQDEPEGEDDRGAPEDLRDERRPRFTLCESPSQRERNGDADDEQEEREDQVGRRAAVPVGVPERRIDRPPGAGIVDEHHPRHGEPAEHVEREKPSRLHTGKCIVPDAGGDGNRPPGEDTTRRQGPPVMVVP